MVEWWWLVIAIIISSGASLVIIGLISSGVRADLESRIFDKDQKIFEQKSIVATQQDSIEKLRTTIEFLEKNFNERLNGLVNLASERKLAIDILNKEIKNQQSVIYAMREKYENKKVKEAS